MNNSSLGLFIISFFALVLSCVESGILVEDISDQTISIVSPQDQASGLSSPVVFWWENLDGADSYRLQVVKGSFNSSNTFVIDTLITQQRFELQLQPNSYEWCVRGENSGFATSFFCRQISILQDADFSDREVNLLSPATDSFISESEISFSWNTVLNASGYRFELYEVDTNGSLIEQCSDFIEDTTRVCALSNQSRYTWQVRAERSNASTLYSMRVFTLDQRAPNQPILSMPLNNARITEDQINFAWTRQDLDGASEFDSLFVYTDQELTNLSFKIQSTSKSYTNQDNIDIGDYYWVVQGFDRAGNSSGLSSVFTFTKN